VEASDRDTIVTYRHCHFPGNKHLGGITARVELNKITRKAKFHIAYCMVDSRGDRTKKNILNTPISREAKKQAVKDMRCTDNFSRKGGREAVNNQIDKIQPYEVDIEPGVPIFDCVLAKVLSDKTIHKPSWLKRSSARKAYIARRLIDNARPAEDISASMERFSKIIRMYEVKAPSEVIFNIINGPYGMMV
jgi:hypothetical protein